MVAFPAIYGDSGIMTFIVNQQGIVFEKNLGPNTTAIARAMARYEPDASWAPAPSGRASPASFSAGGRRHLPPFDGSAPHAPVIRDPDQTKMCFSISHRGIFVRSLLISITTRDLTSSCRSLRRSGQSARRRRNDQRGRVAFANDSL